MAYTNFRVTHFKHIRRRGQTNGPVEELSRATETHFMAVADADADGHEFGINVIALTPTETLSPAVTAALEAAMATYNTANPTDPGTPPIRGG